MTKIRVLIAETHKEQIEFIKKELIRLDNFVEVCTVFPPNGESMYNCIKNLRPHIIITNENKDDIIATDVIQKLQAEDVTYEPHYILISGYSDMPNIISMKNIKNVHFLKKPFDFNLIYENVVNILLSKQFQQYDDFDIIFDDEQIDFTNSIFERYSGKLEKIKIYKEYTGKLSAIEEKFETMPQEIKDLFNDHQYLALKCQSYENALCFNLGIKYGLNLKKIK